MWVSCMPGLPSTHKMRGFPNIWDHQPHGSQDFLQKSCHLLPDGAPFLWLQGILCSKRSCSSLPNFWLSCRAAAQRGSVLRPVVPQEAFGLTIMGAEGKKGSACPPPTSLASGKVGAGG